MEPTSHIAESFFTKAIITGTLFRIRKDAIGFVDLFKFFLSPIFFVHIGMILAREFTERSSDLVIARVPSHAQDFVVIAIAHKFYSTAGRVPHFADRDQQFHTYST